MCLFIPLHSLVVCRAKKSRRTCNQLSFHFTLCFAKDETETAGKGAPLTPISPHTSIGGVA